MAPKKHGCDIIEIGKIVLIIGIFYFKWIKYKQNWILL